MAQRIVWPHCQNTHKISENFTYGFVMGPLQFQSTGQNLQLTFKKNWHTPIESNLRSY